jgi:predicted MPP superfamily phosphohydrolase
VPLALPGWPDRLHGLRVALVADLHAGAGHMTPARVRRVVDRVLACEADVHLLLGDYIDSTPLGDGKARVRDVARELSRLPRSVAVLGNHDWSGRGPAMGWALRDAGLPVLENEAIEVRPGLHVAGLADSRFRVSDAQAALRLVPRTDAVLLMSHSPDVFPRVPEGPALTVAGHLHGGQVNLPLLRRIMLPSVFGERYIAGHVEEGGRHLFVSAGIGTTGVPLRLFRPPEVPILRLRPRPPGRTCHDARLLYPNRGKARTQQGVRLGSRTGKQSSSLSASGKGRALRCAPTGRWSGHTAGSQAAVLVVR